MAEERDVEVAWARIVADYDLEVDDAVARWPAAEELAAPGSARGVVPGADPGADPGPAAGADPGADPGADAGADVGSDTDTAPRTDPGADPGPEGWLRDIDGSTARRATPDGTDDGSADPAERPDREAEQHYVPPPPPPLGRPDLPTGLAWSGVLGGPVLLLLTTVLGWTLPRLLTAGCVIGFVGGMVFLIASMDDGRGRDGWDDGAQV